MCPNLIALIASATISTKFIKFSFCLYKFVELHEEVTINSVYLDKFCCVNLIQYVFSKVMLFVRHLKEIRRNEDDDQ